MAARRLTPLQGEVALALVARGDASVSEVARVYNITPQAVRLRMPGLISATRPERFSDELKAAIAADLAAGMPRAKVAEKHEVKLRTVYYLRRKMLGPAPVRTKAPKRQQPKRRRNVLNFGNY